MPTINRQDFVSAVSSHTGQPYVFGGTSVSATDCSGLIYYVLQSLGGSIPRTSQAMWGALPHIDASQTQPGDLVFFPGASGTAAQPDHVGVCLNQGCTQMIDDPFTGAVVRTDGTGGASGYASMSGTLSGSAVSSSGSGSKGGGGCADDCALCFFGACIFSRGQRKAVVGGLAVAAGGGVVVVGVLMLSAFALNDTRAGKVAAQSARRTLNAGRGSRRRVVRAGRSVGRVSERRHHGRLEAAERSAEEQKSEGPSEERREYQRRRRNQRRDILGQTPESVRARRRAEGFGEAA